MQSEYEIITYDEFKKRKDGGFYLLYWSDTGRYYGGRAVDYSGRRHDECVDEYDSYLNRHWNKHGSPDKVIIVPLIDNHFAFEQLWLDVFRNGKLFDSAVCMNMSGRADAPWDCQTIEQRRENGRKSKGRKHSLEARAKISAASKKGYRLGKGIFGLTAEQRSDAGRKGAIACKEKGVGIWAFSSEQLIKNAKQAYKKGLGKLTTEQRRENYEKGLGKFTTKQRIEFGKMTRKLTQSQVHEIRHLLALGDMSKKEIAEHFPVGRCSIYDIDKGRTYADW